MKDNSQNLTAELGEKQCCPEALKEAQRLEQAQKESVPETGKGQQPEGVPAVTEEDHKKNPSDVAYGVRKD